MTARTNDLAVFLDSLIQALLRDIQHSIDRSYGS